MSGRRQKYSVYFTSSKRELYFNIQGLALGNALSDPINMLEYPAFAYQTGLVDVHGRHAMKLFELLAKEYYPSVESKIVSFEKCCDRLK